MTFFGLRANAGCEVGRVNRTELDGLESVPRLLFLWNRRPRIAAANPRHHVGRRGAVATMALMAYLLGYAGFSTVLLLASLQSDIRYCRGKVRPNWRKNGITLQWGINEA